LCNYDSFSLFFSLLFSLFFSPLFFSFVFSFLLTSFEIISSLLTGTWKTVVVVDDALSTRNPVRKILVGPLVKEDQLCQCRVQLRLDRVHLGTHEGDLGIQSSGVDGARLGTLPHHGLDGVVQLGDLGIQPPPTTGAQTGECEQLYVRPQ